VDSRSIRMSLAGGLILGSVLAACAGAPATPGPATSGPAATAGPTVVATVSPTDPPATATPEIIAISSTFELAESAPDGAIEIVMSLAPGPVFAPTEISAPAGDVTLFLTNPDARYDGRHNFRIGGTLLATSATTPDILPGKAGVLTLEDLESGEYIFWCSVQAHYQAGMQGVLTVTP
jgi:plastocyanin